MSQVHPLQCSPLCVHYQQTQVCCCTSQSSNEIYVPTNQPASQSHAHLQQHNFSNVRQRVTLFISIRPHGAVNGTTPSVTRHGFTCNRQMLQRSTPLVVCSFEGTERCDGSEQNHLTPADHLLGHTQRERCQHISLCSKHTLTMFLAARSMSASWQTMQASLPPSSI